MNRRARISIVVTALLIATASPSVALQPREVVSISMSSPTYSVPVGFAVPVTVTALLSDGTHVDVTRKVRWRAGSKSVALVGRRHRGLGWVTGRSAGTTTLSATWGSKKAWANVRVTNATLVAVSVQPSPLTVIALHDHTIACAGIFSDGTSINVTRRTVWTSSDEAIFTVTGKQLRGIAPGSATLTATVGAIVGTGTIVVTDS